MDNIDMSKALRIAFADTRHLGRARWSELAVYWLAEPIEGGKHWLAVSTGMSSRPGEVAIVDKLVTFRLERALELFDDSAVGCSVKAQAMDWHDAHLDRAGTNRRTGDGNAQAPANAFRGSTDEHALAWLFGDGQGSLRAAARALGAGESTLRAQVKNGTPVKVSLLAIAPYIDRERFLADLAVAHG